jgi:AcrR family transcriptional regulator
MNTNIAAPTVQDESPDAPTARLSARERLLAAAAELFYEQGVQSVGIEKVIERAGVAKASLYGNFKGKDDLVRSYLEARQESRQARITERLATLSKPRDKLLAVFDVLAEAFAQPGYRGCAFVRASAEMRADSSARAVCVGARQWTRELFADLARQAGAARPEELAHQLVLLYDGAAVSAQMDGDERAALSARAVAVQLLDAACAKHARR